MGFLVSAGPGHAARAEPSVLELVLSTLQSVPFLKLKKKKLIYNKMNTTGDGGRNQLDLFERK